MTQRKRMPPAGDAHMKKCGFDLNLKQIKNLLPAYSYVAAALILLFLLMPIGSAVSQEEFAGAGESRGPKIIVMNDPDISFLYDKFEPVRFRHQWHADIVKDCTVCHHYFDKHDELARETGTSCESCHSGLPDVQQNRAIPCSVCHETEFSRANKERVGLKGAIHRLCIDCHQDYESGPVDCMECHVLNVPDHADFISEYEGAETCEECHPGKINEVMNSTHYKLMSKLPLDFLYTNSEATEKAPYAQSGFILQPSPFWATLPQINWLYTIEDDPSTPEIDVIGGCGTCHIGYGLEPFTARSAILPSSGEEHNVDCLVCHSQEYERKYFPVILDGKPMIRSVPTVDGIEDHSIYTEAAQKVGHTATEYCQRCHTRSGESVEVFETGGHSFKRGVGFDPQTDVHAKLGITCSECHNTSEHKFKRKLSSDLLTFSDYRLEEGCLDCHRFVHTSDEMKNMVAKVSCTSCHANSTGGITAIDYANLVKGAGGRTTVSVSSADQEWQPVFRWFNRKVMLPSTPLGSKYDGMLHPYKELEVTLPVDDAGNLMLLSHRSLILDGSIEKAVADGSEDYRNYVANFLPKLEVFGFPPIPGEFAGFETRTHMYTFSHGISLDNVRTCVDCHGANSAVDWSLLGMENPYPIG